MALAKKAGVRLSMHKLRKGFGCRAAKILGKSGAPMLHELMRHSSMQVTMDYYASVDDAKQDAIKQKEIAVENEAKAKAAEMVAKTEQQKAEEAKRAEEYEAYVARIGLEELSQAFFGAHAGSPSPAAR